jgi:hypothetical protein
VHVSRLASHDQDRRQARALSAPTANCSHSVRHGLTATRCTPRTRDYSSSPHHRRLCDMRAPCVRALCTQPSRPGVRGSAGRRVALNHGHAHRGQPRVQAASPRRLRAAGAPVLAAAVPAKAAAPRGVATAPRLHRQDVRGQRRGRECGAPAPLAQLRLLRRRQPAHSAAACPRKAMCAALAMATQASRRTRVVHHPEAETACVAQRCLPRADHAQPVYASVPACTHACSKRYSEASQRCSDEVEARGRTAAAPPRPAAGARGRAPRRAARCAASRRTPARCSRPPCARAATCAAARRSRATRRPALRSGAGVALARRDARS